MNCMPGWWRAMGREPLLELELQGFESERARDRHAATLYLQVAATTHDAAQWTALRRRAAKLILPSKGRRHNSPQE